MRATVLFAALCPACVGFNLPVTGRAGASTPAVDAVGTFTPTPAPSPERLPIGYSHEGRPLLLTRIGRGPRRVLWIGGIHGNEREGRVATAELPAAFRAAYGAIEDCTLFVLEDLNPDGSERDTRGNARGVDLNRNYPAANFEPSRFFGLKPLDQPEARALHDLVLRERPELVIVAHSWRDDHFINFDGPAGHLAERFSALSGYRVQTSSGIAPTPGSLGSWIGGTLGIPILTLEYQRGRDPWAAWNETRVAILSVIRAG